MRAAAARDLASASEPAGASSPPSMTAPSFFVVDSGWATLQLSR